MTVQASFIWKNPDATKDLNRRIEKIVNRGVVFGGNVAPAVGLNVTVDPSVAISFDGMTVVEDQPQTVLVANNTKNYIVLWAKYNDGGSPATPTLLWKVYDEATYLAHPEKDFLIVYCVVDVPPAAVSIILDYIHFEYRDEVNPLARDWYRGTVATPAALPVPPPHGNRVGDFFFVISDRTFHFWTGTAWSPLNTGSYNTETTLMNHLLVEGQHERNVEGSGVVAGPRPGATGDFASDPDILIIETPTVADQVGLDSFSADVNGHRVELHGQYVTMAPKPGIGERYDLIFLEVWREFINPSSAVPEDMRYDRNPDGTLKYTISEVDDKLQKLQWQQGIPTAPPADNFNLNPIDADDHGWNVVKYRLGTVSNLATATLALYNPGDSTVAAGALNIDGNPFTGQPAGSTADDRLWVAPAGVTSVDGFSWAIPLFVVKRTSLEITPNAIQVFRGGVRYVFPVYPVADASHAARKALDTIHRGEATPFGIDHYPYDEPSGFLTGMDFVLQTVSGSGLFDAYDDQVKVRVRGIEDWLETPCGPVVTPPTAPTGVNGWARNLVYLKMNVTLYDNALGSANNEYMVSKRHRPYVPSNLGGTIRGQGWKRGYVQWQIVVEDLGTNDYLDEADAMAASGWTRGDVTMAAANAQYEDGGIWSKSIAIDADDRIHPFLAEWAIPICLVHRKNKQPWAFDANPNGAPGRPDGLVDPEWIYPDDLVDLRHEVGVDEHELEERLKRDIDRMMKGQLRTRLANKHLGAGGTTGEVAGSRVLQTDALGAVVGTAQLTAPDGVRKIWSDAREFYPVAIEFDILASSSGPLYDYVHAGTQGTLKIRAPGWSSPGHAYAQIVRHTPAMLYADSQLRYYGPPCWTTQELRFATTRTFGSTIPRTSPATAKWVDTSTPAQPVEANMAFYYYLNPAASGFTGGQGFEVTDTDALGRAIEMTAEVDTTGITSGTAALSWWVHYDRSFTGSDYAANYGLSAIPDTVHKVIKDPGGTDEELNVGPLYTIVRKAVVGSAIIITAADVSAASGLSGAVTLMGVDHEAGVTDDPAISFTSITSITMNDGRDTITITLPAPSTGSVDIPVFFSTLDVNKWVEVGRGGKSVQAYFEWEEISVTHASATPSGNYAFNIGSATWRNPSVGGRTANGVMPLCWTRAAPGADWTLIRNKVLSPKNGAGYEHSNLISYESDDFDLLALLIVPAHKALSSAAADRCVVHYTYTPYQGLSSDGEQMATIGTSLPKCKELLHGVIEANSDFYVTQSGACSYFSGVDTWTGYPPNHSYYGEAGHMGSARFEEYNETILVKGQQGGGSQELSSRIFGNRVMNAAAVLRLPFPINTNMFSTYHVGAMNFDFDPARAGAAAGYRCYAPSYTPCPSVLTVQLDQFVNSLSALRSNSVAPQQDVTAVVPPYAYTSTPLTTGELIADGWRANNPGEVIQVYIDARAKGCHLPKRVATYMEIDNWLGGTTGLLWPNSGTLIPITAIPAKYLQDISAGAADPRWTSKEDVGNAVISIHNMYYVVNPGSIMEWYLTNDPTVDRMNFVQAMLYPHRSAFDGTIAGTTAVTDTEEVYNKDSGYGATSPFAVGKAVDMVVRPFGSSAQRRQRSIALQGELEDSLAMSVSSLKGKLIEYPAWSGPTITTLEGLITATTDSRNAGRGLYLSNSTGDNRLNMPVLVPGTGTSLTDVCRTADVLLNATDLTPEGYPYMPGEPLFADNNQAYYKYDHGGPLAYVCFGLLVQPTADTYKNQLVLQISGGPTGGTGVSTYTQDDLDGTAIDAFWPSRRPLMKSKK